MQSEQGAHASLEGVVQMRWRALSEYFPIIF